MSNKISNLSTIAVSPEVKQALGKLGHAGESYNEVLKRLLKIEEKESLSDQVGGHNQTAKAKASDIGGNDLN